MRLEVSIPDPLFNGAQRAAAARGLTLEAYMADALELRLQDDPEDDMAWFFTPQRLGEIKEAQAEVARGESISVEQFKAERQQWRREWLENHPA